MVLESSTLCVKYLPPELSADDREELLKLVGAVSVRVMPDDGKMKFCAFATFQSHGDAKHALFILHQRQILGKRLVVEYAASEKHKKCIPHITDNSTFTPAIGKETSSNLSEREVLRLGSEEFSRKLHGVAPALGLDYIPSPLLKYKYPTPTPTVIQNINHALISVPKFYTQVLHLMNKMNLPVPFGPVTPAPPLRPDVCLNVAKSVEVSTDTDDLIPDVTSEEESEYESDEEGEKITVETKLPMKRSLPKPKQKVKKKKIMHKTLNYIVSSKPRTEPSEIFESQLITQKKINVKKIDQIAPTESAVTNVESTSGFGAFEASREVKDVEVQKEPVDEIWDDSQFITMEEIKDKRISSREMKTLSIFRNFSPGEPTCRLYIKNLARQVEEKNLKYIFGRFIDRNSETDRNMFDIKLMKEGRMKGQAFVTLANEDQALQAVKETNGFVLHTKPMVVQFARSAKAKEDDKKGKK